MNKKSHHGIRNRIVLLSTAFTLLTGLFISYGGYYLYNTYLEGSFMERADTDVRFLADDIRNQLASVDQLSHYFQTNSTISAYIESHGKSPNKRNAAFEVLSDYVNNFSGSYLHRVVITNLSDNYIQYVMPTYSSTVNVSEALKNQPFYSVITDSEYDSYTVGFTADPFSNRQKNVLPYIKPIAYSFTADLGGYVFIEIDESLFAQAIESERFPEGITIITLGDHSYIYEDSFTEVEGDWEFTSSENTSTKSSTAIINHIKDENNQEYLAISEPFSYNCYVTRLIPIELVNVQKEPLYRMLLYIIILMILLGILLTVTLDHAISDPFKRINKKLARISEGDFARDTSIEWNNELGDVGRRVNDLAEDMLKLIDSRIEDEKQKKDLEYKVLQSQINPHFLYNTLNSIKWMAQIQGANGIVEMTTALARLLKSISKGTKLMIPISEELVLVKDYFTIQKYRYGGTIDLEVTVDDDSLNDFQIIKFTLQPLVENAIFHGIEPTGGSGVVKIFVYQDGDDIRLDVTDNGVGMSEEQIAKVMSEDNNNPSEFFKEVGVSNVHTRLQYEFGHKYGITIDSVQGKYTTMSILIPMVKTDV